MTAVKTERETVIGEKEKNSGEEMMKKENAEVKEKKEKKSFFSTLLNKIRPEKEKKNAERKKSGSGGTF